MLIRVMTCFFVFGLFGLRIDCDCMMDEGVVGLNYLFCSLVDMREIIMHVFK